MKVKLNITEINSNIEQAMSDYIQDTVNAFVNVVKIIDNDYCKRLDEIEEEEDQ